MGIYDRDYYRKEGPSFLDSIIPDGRVCRWLIGLNILMFVLQLIFQRSIRPIGPDLTPEQFGEMFRQMLDPSGPVTQWLRLDTAAVSNGEVWRLITHAFLHDTNSFLHLAFNMLCLWMFGTDVEVVYGPREFLSFYLMSALIGGVAFYVWALTQPFPSMYAVGASGAVTGVLVLCACHFPSRTVSLFMLIPVSIWLFVVFLVAWDVYRVINSAHGIHSTVGAVAHLGGGAFAFLYYRQQWRILNLVPRLNFRWKARARGNLRIYRPEDEREAVSVGAPVASDMDEHLEAKLDAVLEKVSRQGKESLTENEHKILMRASEIYKRKRT